MSTWQNRQTYNVFVVEGSIERIIWDIRFSGDRFIVEVIVRAARVFHDWVNRDKKRWASK